MSNDSNRTAYVAGLRAFADALETQPDLMAPGHTRLLLSLTTNAAVEEFATTHGLDVAHDAEGNASATLHFGPIEYHAYGYVDFAEHCKRLDEQRARAWAEENGLVLQSVDGGAS